METTGMRAPFSVVVGSTPAASRRDRRERRPPPASTLRRVGVRKRPWYPQPGLTERVQEGLVLGRKRRLELQMLAAEGVGEAEAGGEEELPAERGLRDAVDGVTHDRQVDRRQVNADLVHASGLEPHLEEGVAADLA